MKSVFLMRALGNIYRFTAIAFCLGPVFCAWAEDFCPTTAEIGQAKHAKDVDLLNDWLLHSVREATQNSPVPCAEQLLAAGADPNIKDYGGPILEKAVSSKNVALVKALMTAGADVNAPLWGTYSVFPRIAELNDLDLVKQAFSAGGKTARFKGWDKYALLTALKNGRFEIVKFMLQNGVSPKIEMEGESLGLAAAAASGDLEIFHYFKGLGVPVTNRLLDKNESSLIHDAAAGGNVEIIKEVMKQGGNLNLLTSKQESPLFKAASNGRVEAVRFFIKNGSYGQQIKSDERIMNAAISSGNLEIVNILLQAGASLDCKNKETEERLASSLYYNATEKRKSFPIVKYCLDRGSDPEKFADIAISTDNVELLKELKSHGTDLKAANAAGEDRLSIAVRSQPFSLAMVEYLMSLGFKMDKVNKSGGTAFSAALQIGNLKAVQFFAKQAGLEKAPDKARFWDALTALDSSGENSEDAHAFVSAVSSRNLALVKFLAENGAMPKKNEENTIIVLETSLNGGDRSMFELLLKQGFAVPQDGKSKLRLMQAAARTGQLKMVKALEGKGVQIQDLGSDKDSLLFEAASSGSFELVRYLVSKGCDPRAKNELGETVLSRSACNADHEVTKFLVEKGGDPNAVDPLSHSTLIQSILSCYNQDLNLLKFLQKHGADFKKKPVDGQPLLNISARASSKEVFEFVLHAVSDPRQKSVFGRSALFEAVCHYSSRGGFDEIERIKLLAKYDSAGLKTKDAHGATLLHRAAECGNLPVIKFLLDQGLDLNQKDDDDLSPLHAAFSSGFPQGDTVEYLLKKQTDAGEIPAKGAEFLVEMLRRGCSNEKDISRILHLLVNAGADLNSKNKDGTTPLRQTVSLGCMPGIRALLSEGARIEQKDLRTLYGDAIASDDSATLQFIASQGKIDLESPDVQGQTALQKSLLDGKFNATKAVLEAGAKVDGNVEHNGITESLLSYAATELQNAGFVELLHKAGARFQSKEGYLKALKTAAYGNLSLFKYLMEHCKDYPLATADLDDLLRDAVSNADVLRYLFEKGANPKSEKAISTFNEAARLAAVESLELLLARGVPHGEKDPSGEPYVFLAVRSGDEKIIKIFLTDKKWLKEKDPAERAILHWAVPSKNIGLVKSLVRQGADLKAEDSDGEGLLFGALGNGEMLDYLIQQGLDPKASSNKITGDTLLHALIKGYGYDYDKEVFARLMESGVDVNVKNRNGKTPLHLALELRNVQMAKKLIESGANLSIPDDNGVTPAKLIRQWNDPSLTSVLTEAEKIKLEEMKKRWQRWVKDPSLPLTDAQLIESLILNLDDKKLPPAPPSSASGRLQSIYKNIKAARFSPEILTSASLELEDLPPSYYREILQGASSLRAQKGRPKDKPPIFNPSTAQVRKVLNVMLSDPLSSQKDLEALSWLLVQSRLNVDVKLLDQFKIPEDKLKADVEAMLLSEPLQYKGVSSFAAIKLVKALLAYPDSEFDCSNSESAAGGATGSTNNAKVSHILNWFGNYGNSLGADRVFFSKLARLMLERKKLCSRDRDLLLAAMRQWRDTTGQAQGEVVCAVSASLGSAPLLGRPLEELTLIATMVGLRSELTGASWIEQMRAFGELRVNRGGGSLSGDEQEIYNGLLKFILGNPGGAIEAFQNGQKRKVFGFPQTDPKPGYIVKLCRLLKRKQPSENPLTEEDANFITGASLWLQLTREGLDQPRRWPDGFEAPGVDLRQTMRQEFSHDPALAADLAALDSSCEVLPGPNQPKKPLSIYQERKKQEYDVFSAPGQSDKSSRGNKPASKQRRRTRPGDFNPNGRL